MSVDHECSASQERKAPLRCFACVCFFRWKFYTLKWVVYLFQFRSSAHFQPNIPLCVKHKDAHTLPWQLEMCIPETAFAQNHIPSQIFTQLIIIFGCTALVHPLSPSWNDVFNDPIKLPTLILIYLKDPALVTLFRSFEAWVNMTNGFQVFPLPSAHPESSSPTRWDGHADNLIKL